MLYQAYQLQDDLVGQVRYFATWGRWLGQAMSWGQGMRLARRWDAALEMVQRYRLTATRPDFHLKPVPIGNREVPIGEEVVAEFPFGRLLHFAKDVATPQPKLLVLAPLSGHYATLLAATVQTLSRDHDVYITDWVNARDVPVSAGRFGVEDYVDYVIRFLEIIGPGAHILAVCQPCVQGLAAVAVMSEDKNPATPLSMTLMAGPIDVRESPTKVNDLANERPLDWFKRSVIASVPRRYAGSGRRVYPGFVQLTAFVMMNLERHKDQHRKLFRLLSNGETEEAEKIKTFYDEYFAVLDLTEEFYIETIDRIFQQAQLATGQFTYRGRRVDPGAIRKTALLTVEGGRDDICALGQTSAAHDLCSSLRPHLKRHHLQANVGHYGVFNGKRWEREIYPVVRNHILAME
ncbi:MAG: polyhydroxyalkanoate depolymerase [Amaricoccus sp.]